MDKIKSKNTYIIQIIFRSFLRNILAMKKLSNKCSLKYFLKNLMLFLKIYFKIIIFLE